MATRARSRYEIAADDKTERALKNINKNIRSVHNSFVSLRTIVVGVAGAAGLGALIDRSLEAADAIGKQADALGLTTDQYQELVFVADKAAISQQQFNSNMTAFVKRVGEARAGLGPLTSFMRKYDDEVLLNIVNSGSQEQALNIVSEAIRNASDAAERAAIANAAFGRSGINMVNALDDGPPVMEEWRQKARDLGLVIDEEVIRNSERAGDQLAILSDVMRTRLTVAFAAAAPQIEEVAVALIKALDAATEFFNYLNDNVSEVDILREEIAELGEQIAITTRGLEQGAARGTPFARWVKDRLGIETPDELEAQLEELNQIVWQKQQELEELLRPEEAATQGEAGTAAPGIAPPAVQDFGIDEQKLLERFEVINQALLSEEEQLKIHFENSRLIIEDAYVTGIIPTELRYRELLQELELRHQNKMSVLAAKGLTQRQKFLRMSMVAQVQTIAGELANATSAVAQENEVMFRLNQAAGIANVIITTIQGINRAFADFPYPIALGISAAIAAGGAINVATIASQSIGGSSVSPSDSARGAVSGPVPIIEPSGVGTTQEVQSVQQVSITLNGTGYSKQDVRDLIESINEELGDGLVLQTT